ncbi:hypothetical protein [Streptomyces sp. WMMB 322]|uniref:hypothetical protein n=1 Tax=Streptomyces sp. WMMB 322 TaxID=1286821 RepID=UPI0006E3E491|nr:hypothetical protein [Streptomyces sp. WMMB 322]SCK42649.1 hypothetical protein H180DRAFT_03720 [Streptomyces sp. WMMB 322]
MAESVPVRCPECRREHTYTPPVYPCDCGAPVTLPMLRDGTPAQIRHRTWAGSWVEVRCPSCGTSREWPQPELGCRCGTLLRMPVVPPQPSPRQPPPPAGDLPGTAADRAPGTAAEAGHPAGTGGVPVAGDADGTAAPSTSAGTPAGSAGPFTAPAPLKAHDAQKQPRHAARPAFRPVTIRTAQDARTAAAEYLRWLGFPEVRVTERRPASGVDVRGSGIIAHVDPTTAPTTLREVETLWLNGLNEGVGTACFSLAGYSREARTRADSLSVPLFVLDLTGMPQAVNDPADDLVRSVY